MRPKLVTALCLLTAGACAHQQQPTEESIRAAPRASNTQLSEAAQSSPAADRSSSTAAVRAQPAQPAMSEPADMPSGTTSQSLANPPLAGATAAEPQPGSGQQQAIPKNDVPVPPFESRELARAPSAEEIALRERIQSTLGTAAGLSYSARHVSVAVDKQDVTLKGDVRNERERKDVESLVQQIQGVKRVKNQLSSR